MYDVFYTGPKPNLFSFEQSADNLATATALCKTKYFWFLDGHNDYSKFDFGYQPVPWESDHTHVWPSQWQQNGGTCLVPAAGITEHQWHWHDDGPVIPRTSSTEIFYMDFLNKNSAEQFQQLKLRWPNIRSTRYVDSHLNMFKRIVNLATRDDIWIISSICDYSKFDFTWHPKQWQENMIHVFASGTQSRGDTFFLRCSEFKKQAAELDLLDWFHVINYCNDQSVDRWSEPQHIYDHDNLVEEIKQHDFVFPYELFSNFQLTLMPPIVPCMWSQKDRAVFPITPSHSVAIVPRDVKSYIQTQVYDYPYILEPEFKMNIDQSLDIIYISNGEPEEDKWAVHLQATLDKRYYQRKFKWVRGVNGRSQAYKAAAELSNTPWFFAVFAKLEVVDSFDWHWQPDYFQEPKHYIFNAKNPVNGLEYGHMGVLAYNKRLVLETTHSGLDFTLSKPHAVVPILSAIAHFNSDPWMTWRTAFREVVKLKYFSEAQPSTETDYRLKIWLTRAEGTNAKWSLQGAKDAVDYYSSVNGNYEQLKLTFEWGWLREYAAQLGYFIQ